MYLCTYTHALTPQKTYQNPENFSFSSCLLATESLNWFSELHFSFTSSLLHLPAYIVLHLLSSWLKSSLHQKARFNNSQYTGTCCTALTVSFRSCILLDVVVFATCTVLDFHAVATICFLIAYIHHEQEKWKRHPDIPLMKAGHRCKNALITVNDIAVGPTAATKPNDCSTSLTCSAITIYTFRC